MAAILWVVLGLIVLGLLVALLAYNKKKKIPPDYYAFFIMGLIWAPFGAISRNYSLMTMGLVFLALGLANKDKWKKNHKTWKDLDSKEQKIRLLLILFLGVIVLVGLVFFYLART